MDKSSIINYAGYTREAAKMSSLIPNPHHKRYNNLVLKKKWNNKKLPEWIHNELPWWKAKDIEFIQERRLRNLLSMPKKNISNKARMALNSGYAVQINKKKV